MDSAFRFVSTPHPCSYLPGRTATTEYDLVASRPCRVLAQGRVRF